MRIQSAQDVHEILFPNPKYQRMWITALEDINRRNQPTEVTDLISRTLDAIVIAYSLDLGEEIDLTAQTYSNWSDLKQYLNIS